MSTTTKRWEITQQSAYSRPPPLLPGSFTSLSVMSSYRAIRQQAHQKVLPIASFPLLSFFTIFSIPPLFSTNPSPLPCALNYSGLADWVSTPAPHCLDLPCFLLYPLRRVLIGDDFYFRKKKGTAACVGSDANQG